jgi:hypothetical protein
VELKQKNTFVNWDMVNIWSIDQGNSYPWLKRLKNPHNGNEPYSPEVDIPTGLAYTPTSASGISVYWDMVLDADGYEVKIDGKSYYSNTTSYLIENLNPNIQYEIKVRSLAGSFASEWSTAINVIVGNAKKLSELTLNCTIGKRYFVPVIASNYPSFTNKTFTIEYTAGNLQLVNFAAQLNTT